MKVLIDLEVQQKKVKRGSYEMFINAQKLNKSLEL